MGSTQEPLHQPLNYTCVMTSCDDAACCGVPRKTPEKATLTEAMVPLWVTAGVGTWRSCSGGEPTPEGAEVGQEGE